MIGGYTPACLERAKALYGRAIKTIVPVSSCRAAEATKLLENIFRSVNIALVNELKFVYPSPFGFPALGGPCGATCVLPLPGSAGVHPPSRIAGLRRTGPAGLGRWNHVPPPAGTNNSKTLEGPEK